MQSYLIKQVIKLYEAKSWTTIYHDFPGGQRSGVGNRAKINRVWERTLNLSPDIVFINNDEIRIFEVDKAFSENYLTKFIKYKSREDELAALLGTILNISLNRITYGFASLKNITIRIDELLLPFYYIFYDGEKLFEIDITSSQK